MTEYQEPTVNEKVDVRETEKPNFVVHEEVGASPVQAPMEAIAEKQPALAIREESTETPIFFTTLLVVLLIVAGTLAAYFHGVKYFWIYHLITIMCSVKLGSTWFTQIAARAKKTFHHSLSTVFADGESPFFVIPAFILLSYPVHSFLHGLSLPGLPSTSGGRILLAIFYTLGMGYCLYVLCRYFVYCLFTPTKTADFLSSIAEDSKKSVSPALLSLYANLSMFLALFLTGLCTFEAGSYFSSSSALPFTRFSYSGLALICATILQALMTAYARRKMDRAEALGRFPGAEEEENYLLLSKAQRPVFINYKHLAASERWLKQRFSQRSAWKSILFLGLIAAVILIDPSRQTEFLARLISAIGAAPNQNTSGGPGELAALPFFLNLNNMLVLTVTGAFFSTVIGYIFYFMRAPIGLLAGPYGYKFTYRFLSGIKRKYTPWQNLEEIKFENKAIVLQANNGKTRLKLDSFEEVEDREKFLQAINKYAPSVKRAPEVVEALSPPADHSYTELWLQALSAPPKRERLRALAEGALLQGGRYRVAGELGAGGQGFAYLAYDKNEEGELELEGKVVLKEFVLPIYVDIQARKSALERFENEARLLSRLDNERVVKLRHFFIEDHRAYLVLEHIEGKNLRQWIEERREQENNGTFTPEEVRELALKMAQILTYLHSLAPPLVHRDFTPDNLIMDRSGNLKLIDFNVAQEMQESTTGTVVGKQAYLPPEQFRGKAEPASDIYAMAATLCYLLTGRDPVPISTIQPEAEGLREIGDSGLPQLLNHMTQIDPGKRPSAERVLELLQDLKK